MIRLHTSIHTRKPGAILSSVDSGDMNFQTVTILQLGKQEEAR